jgi:hypothetical protein
VQGRGPRLLGKSSILIVICTESQSAHLLLILA